MKKPIIALTPLYDEKQESQWMLEAYLTSIRSAGAVPVVLALETAAEDAALLARRFDGFLFTGGQDVNPALYGEEVRPACGVLCSGRDTLEAALYQAAAAADKPILGICRGAQIINALAGGTLYQDLPSEYGSALMEHLMEKPYDRSVHAVTLEQNTPLHRCLGMTRLQVNSIHHQAVKTLGKGCRVMARSADGLVEAIYLPEHRFIWGVQWHPEFLYETDEPSRKIFTAFVEACREK